MSTVSPSTLSLLQSYSSNGDLLFFGRCELSECNDFESAILCSTDEATNLFHVGILYEKEEGDKRIVHATEKGVVVQRMEDVMGEMEAHCIQCTVEERNEAVSFAVSKEGCVYNDIFSPDCIDSSGKEAYYCSQLVTSSYSFLSFPPHKMKFADNDYDILPYWVEYFGKRNTPVPLGADGSHPSTLVHTKAFNPLMSIRLSSSLSSSFHSPSRLSHLHWIAGRSVQLNGSKSFDVIEPRSGKVVSQCSSATKEEVASVVELAAKAQLEWEKRTWLERGNVLRKTAELIRTHLEDLSLAECNDNGKPLYEARADVLSCAETFEFYSGVGSALAGSHFPLDSDRYAFTRREAIGVVGCVGAWNYPLQTCSWKSAPALAAGNAVVYKPSPLAPVTASLLGDVLKEAGLPDGVYNVVQGDGETGSALIENDLTRKVSFTGSIATGKRIMQACATRSIKPVTLELGGKSSLVILQDADIDSSVAGAMIANFYSQGQVCSNASKVLVHRSILDEFTSKLVEKTRSMKIGDPLDESTRVGASICLDHLNKVSAYIRGAVSQGARLLCGGERVTVSGLEGGYYLSPAILTQITRSMTEEIFGAVLLIIPFDDDEEALRIANDTRMGLAAGVFTKDLAKAHSFSSRLKAGNVYVNTYNDVSPFVPFGGYDQSGYGRENGTTVLDHYTQTKSVFVNTAPLENPF